MAPPSRLPDVFRVERQYAGLMGLAVVTGLLGATGNEVFRAAISGAATKAVRVYCELHQPGRYDRWLLAGLLVARAREVPPSQSPRLLTTEAGRAVAGEIAAPAPDW
jgi:hypothetical protein